MKRYLKNLWLAIIGEDPYQRELKELEKKVSQCEKVLMKEKERVRSYQNLTENLRDSKIKCDQELAGYWNENLELRRHISDLREDMAKTLDQLQKANQKLGGELVNTAQLEKLQRGLIDLCSAMANDDVETLLAITGYLDWSESLTTIARHHLRTVRRNKELEEQLKNARAAAMDENSDFE